MAGGVAMSAEPGKNYPGKVTLHVILACVFAATGGLIFGYDLGISGGVTSMDPFLEKFFPAIYRKQKGLVASANQYCKYDDQLLTLFTSSLYLAALISCLVASHATRRFGRRVVMFTGGGVFLAGAIMNGLAQNVAMLIVGRILLGFGVGLVNQSVPLYLSEMAPHKHRGRLNMMFQLAITIGILGANLVNFFTAKMESGNGWRYSLGGAAVPGLIIFLGGIFLPDTPNSLLERGEKAQAEEQLRKVRGTDEVWEEFNDLVAASEASKKISNPWGRLLWDRKYRPQLVFAVAIPLFQQLTGINVVMFYAPVLFKTLGFGGKASLMSSVITGVVNVAATLVGILSVDKVGRRVLFLQGGSQMFIFQIAVGGLIWHKFGVSGVATLGTAYAGFVVACICIYVAGFAWSWGPLGWLVPSEIFSLEVRSAAQSVNVSVNMIATFAIAQLFLSALCRLKFGLFFMFAVIVFGMSLFIYYLLPETKGVPIEEVMDKVWKQHPYWKNYIPEESEPKKRVELGVV